MKTSRITLALLFSLLPLVSGCGDVLSPEPLGAQTAELAQIQSLLTEVLTRLDSLESQVAAHDSSVVAEVTALAGLVDTIGVEVGVGGGIGLSAGVEVSLCGNYEASAAARMRSSVTLRGAGEGTVGADVYGNGLTGDIRAFGGQMVSVIPQGGVSGNLGICAILEGHIGADGELGFDVTDPVFSLLNNLKTSVGTSGLSSFASARNMDGARVGQAMDALSSFSMANVPFGGGGASSLVNSLPIPPGLATFLNDPQSIFGQASEAATYAIDQLCGTSLAVDEFASFQQASCDLRGNWPDPGTAINIFSGLQGIAPSVQNLQTAMGSVCNTVGSVVGKTLVIPSRSITILGTSYTTFPGYTAPLFPGFAAPNC